MNSLIITFLERKSEWMQALFEHLQISLLALLIAIFIAIPLSIVLSNKKKLSEIFLQITGVFQTIPSLALLGLFIPFLGIGVLPAILTLVIYAIFPILQNALTGFEEINPSLKEAATAFGMSKLEKLKKYELSLAMPVIISGIRTSAVLIIGTATLATLIGAGGLGSFIMLGIDRNNTSLILIGAISSAVLAILISVSIKFLQTKKLSTILTSLIAIVILLSLSFYKSNPMSTNKFVIASKLGAEPEILINMYKELIEYETDIKVELKANFGKTSFLYEALKSKNIDMYPEFTGTITSTLLKEKPKDIPNKPEVVYEIARDLIYKQDDLIYLKPMKFQNTYALAVKKEYAINNDLKNISDLIKVQSEAIAGFSLEFNDREDGNLGLKQLYNLDLSVKTMEPALRYKAILNGDVSIIDVYSTDSQIISNNLVVLNDDKNLFPPYQAAPLLRSDTLKKYPKLKEVLEKLHNKVTSEEMSKMNYEVDVEGKSANDVARNYLIKEGLIK